MTPTQRALVLEAWFRSASRTYKLDPKLRRALEPNGGDWACIAREGAITRTVVWGAKDVALVNPRGDLLDAEEGRIAMAIRALPTMDRALRVIEVLAEDRNNFDLIREIAATTLAYVMQPAPAIVEPDEPNW